MRNSLSTVMLMLILLTTMLTLGRVNSSVPQILGTILKDDRMKSCELIFINIKGNGASNNTTISVMDIHSGLLSNLDLIESTAGTFTVTNEGSFKNKSVTIKYRRLHDIHRLNKKHCGTAVLYISQVTPGLSEWLFDTIIPRYVPIIRKDEDHFLFVFNSESDANTMLSSPEFGRKIKYKVGIVSKLEKESAKPLIKQVDLFAENGECIVNSLSSLPPDGVNSLFKDIHNFNGKRMHVVSPKAPSYFEVTPDPNGKTYRPVRGLYKVWLDVMIERFNFTVRVTFSSASGSTGKRLKNGTWVGSVGDVLAGRADMACFNGHIYNRHEYVDWSAPITYEWMVFITHKPRSFFSPSAIYHPFPMILWIGIFVSIGLICVLMKILSKYAYETDVTLVTVREMVMYIYSSFLEQDAQMYLPILHLSTVRVLVTFWLLFAVVISTAYRGKLVSLIAFPALTWVPTTFDELAYSNYRVGLNVFGKGGATYSVLSTSKSPIYQTFFKRMELYPDPVKCLKAAFHYNLGCLMVKSVADFYGAKNFTNKFGLNPFQASDQTALFREDGYIWEKRAVFRHQFDRVTWSMMEAGLTNLWFQKDLELVKKKRLDWERLNPGIYSDIQITAENEGPSKLQVAHLIGLFYVYICGHILGVLTVVWERMKICRETGKRGVPNPNPTTVLIITLKFLGFI